MKLLRYGLNKLERPGVLDGEGNIRDLSQHFPDFKPEVIGSSNYQTHWRHIDIEQLPKVKPTVRLGPPIANPGKLICIAFNSLLHTKELGLKATEEENIIFFLKANSSICGPNDPIIYTPIMRKLDWEAELAFVIGKKGKYIEKERAHEHILGYTCMNDLSERYLQFESGDSQFTKAKCFDNAAPLGPYIVTPDELSNPERLEVNLWVNNKLRQAFNTQDYIHHEAAIIHYVSQYFTLYPGDIISMGSAPGNAKYWGDKYYLKPGDKVSLVIPGVGRQSQVVMVEENLNRAHD